MSSLLCCQMRDQRMLNLDISERKERQVLIETESWTDGEIWLLSQKETFGRNEKDNNFTGWITQCNHFTLVCSLSSECCVNTTLKHTQERCTESSSFFLLHEIQQHHHHWRLKKTLREKKRKKLKRRMTLRRGRQRKDVDQEQWSCHYHPRSATLFSCHSSSTPMILIIKWSESEVEEGRRHQPRLVSHVCVFFSGKEGVKRSTRSSSLDLWHDDHHPVLTNTHRIETFRSCQTSEHIGRRSFTREIVDPSRKNPCTQRNLWCQESLSKTLSLDSHVSMMIEMRVKSQVCLVCHHQLYLSSWESRRRTRPSFSRINLSWTSKSSHLDYRTLLHLTVNLEVDLTIINKTIQVLLWTNPVWYQRYQVYKTSEENVLEMSFKREILKTFETTMTSSGSSSKGNT